MRRESKPFCQACENNRDVILAVLRRAFADARHVLEIGSGTGQHAAYFAPRLPHLTWHSSDLPGRHSGIEMWLREAGAANAPAPLELDVRSARWPVREVDGVFSANTAHIMHWEAVRDLFAGVGRVLSARGRFALYGPFSYAGEHTSASNAQFDRSLRAQDPGMGVRAFEEVDALASRHGLRLVEDVAMPANNRTLLWCKGGNRLHASATTHES